MYLFIYSLTHYLYLPRLRQAEVLRLAGNDAYKNGKLPEAMLLYERALYHCNFEKSSTSFTLTDAHRLQIYQTNEPIRVNCSLMMLKMGDYRSCIQHAKEITENNESIKFTSKKTLQKLYFILGKAYYRLYEYDQAEMYTLKSKEICESIDAEKEAGREAGKEARKEAGNDAGNEEGKDAVNEAGKDAVIEAGKEVGKEAGNEEGNGEEKNAGKEAEKDAGNEAGNEVGKEAVSNDENAILSLLNSIKSGRLSAKKHENIVWSGKLAPKFIPNAIETTTDTHAPSDVVHAPSDVVHAPSDVVHAPSDRVVSSTWYYVSAMVVLIASYYVYQLYK